MNRMRLTSWCGAAMIAIATVACSNDTEDKASDAARDAGNAVERAGERTSDAAREAGRDAGDAIQRAGEATATAGREAASATGAAIETMDVKLALTADSRVDASDINVDTDHNTKTVTLKGKVPTAAQKTIAGDIATAKAMGYRVRNDLTVGR